MILGNTLQACFNIFIYNICNIRSKNLLVQVDTKQDITKEQKLYMTGQKPYQLRIHDGHPFQ